MRWSRRRSALDYVEVRDVDEVLATLRRLRDDPKLRADMAHNGRQRALEYLSRADQQTEIESNVRVLHTELFHLALIPGMLLLVLERMLVGTRLRRIP